MIKGSKKMLTIILFVIFLLALTMCVVINLPQFGKLPSGARLERIKRSPQWKEGKFNNELETVTMTGDKNLFQAMWSFVFDKAPDVEPKDSVPVIKTDLHKLEKDENLIVWFGHSFEYWGYDAGIVTEMDWWDRKAFADGIVFNCTPARHFSGRKLFDNAKTLWASFVIEKDSTNVFIGGDSGYSGHFKKISEKFGHIDLAFMENGQYNQDWNQIHTMPEEMVKEATELHASLIFSVHYGKFALARHSWDEPYRNIEKIRQAGFTVVKGTIGEVVKY